jgi:ArsR family transcriptional regulator
MPASGHQDHTTSPSASALFVQQRLRVHRILPLVDDVGQRPSVGKDARINAPDLPDGTSGISFLEGLDRANQLDPLQQFRANEKPLTSASYFHSSGYMESEQAILALAALAQATRLEVFRLLVRREPHGLAAGDIARTIAVPQNTMSSHLSILSRAGLVSARRFSRSIVYRANLTRFQRLMLFMLEDCCDGRREICGPLVESLMPCSVPKRTRKAHV